MSLLKRKIPNETFLVKINEEEIGTIVSVSITFYKPETNEFLICNEMRKHKKDSTIKSLMSHMIGGKFEDIDDTPLHTAVRELNEELGLNFETECIIESLKEEGVIIHKYDFCVNNLYKYYNRFLIVDINSMKNDDVFKALDRKINNYSNLNNEDGVQSVYFLHQKKRLINPTSLLLSFWLKFVI